MSLVLNDWNVVASVREGQFGPGKFDLSELGAVGETDFSDVLVVRVDDVDELLETLEQRVGAGTNFFRAVRMLRPVRRQFTFESIDVFGSRILEAALETSPLIDEYRFDVHVSLRGTTERLGTGQLRHRLRDELANRLGKRCEKLVADDERAEVLWDVETVGRTAGVAAWTAGERDRYPFLELG